MKDIGQFYVSLDNHVSERSKLECFQGLLQGCARTELCACFAVWILQQDQQENQRERWGREREREKERKKNNEYVLNCTLIRIS